MSFLQPLDIAKRALQHLGQPTIAALTETNPQATQMSAVYANLRRDELEANPWTFAARRAVLRSRTSTTFRMTPLAWAIGTTYGVGDVVQDSLGYLWISVRATNLAQTPGQNGAGSIGVNPYWVAYSGPLVADVWASGTFFPRDVVYKTGAPAKAYIALPAQGTSVTTQDPAGGAPWHEIAGATVAAISGLSPLSWSLAPSALASTATHRLVYDLPANYLRIAPQDEKTADSASLNFLTAGWQFNDFEIEEALLFTEKTGPLLFRFTADHTDVSTMHSLFCKMLALSMAKATCMVLTGSGALESKLEADYEKVAQMARVRSLIEQGSAELPARPQPAQQPQARAG